MKNPEKDLLKNMFREIKMKNPSVDFMENLMMLVEKEAIKKQRKRLLYSYLAVLAGIIGMVGLPVLVLFFLKIDISFNFNILDVFSEVAIEPSYILFFLIILFLLIGDTLLRKHFRIF